MKRVFTIVLVLTALSIIIYISVRKFVPGSSETGTDVSFDAKNSSFIVENMPVTLVNGVSEIGLEAVSGAKITTRYFGNEAQGDLNQDGRNDFAFLVTQDGGGSGTFYYVVAALKTSTGYKITNAVSIGDRVSPQSTEIDSQTGELRVNYAERKKEEPMTTAPSVGVTKYLKVTSQGSLEEENK